MALVKGVSYGFYIMIPFRALTGNKSNSSKMLKQRMTGGGISGDGAAPVYIYIEPRLQIMGRCKRDTQITPSLFAIISNVLAPCGPS